MSLPPLSERRIMNNKDLKKKKFNLFDSQREGKGVEKGEVKRPTFLNFFKYYGRSLTKLLNVNLMFTLLCFPVFFFFFGMAGFFDKFAYSANTPMFSAVLAEIELGNINPSTLSLYGAYCQRTENVRLMSTTSIVFMLLTALLLFTWGYANCGMSYVIRNMQRGEPVFMFADFKETIKKNKLQGMLLGILDIAFIFLIVYDLEFFRINAGVYMYAVLFYVMMFIAVVYMIMRFYMYLLLVTFDLSIFKILKNSFLFVFIGIKRNILGLIGTVLTVAVNLFLFIAYRPIGIILPFVLTASTLGYIMTYTAYPKIKEIMIDPYYDENGEELVENEETE